MKCLREKRHVHRCFVLEYVKNAAISKYTKYQLYSCCYEKWTLLFVLFWIWTLTNPDSRFKAYQQLEFKIGCIPTTIVATKLQYRLMPFKCEKFVSILFWGNRNSFQWARKQIVGITMVYAISTTNLLPKYKTIMIRVHNSSE